LLVSNLDVSTLYKLLQQLSISEKSSALEVLRNQNIKLENGKDLSDLFNFNKVELSIDSKYIK